MSRCSAPVDGHHSLAATANCPLHGLGPMTAKASQAAKSRRPTLEWTDLRNESEDLRAYTAAQESTDRKSLSSLAIDPSDEVRCAVARNRSTPPEVLGLMYSESRESQDERMMRVCLRVNPSTPPELLSFWAEQGDSDTSLAVAGNPSTPQESLAIIAGRALGTMTMCALAENPSTAPETLISLSTNRSSNVRHSCARNGKLPSWRLSEMVNDEDVYTRLSAESAVADRIIKKFDIDEQNRGAIEALRTMEWWNLTPDSDEVVVTMTMFANLPR